MSIRCKLGFHTWDYKYRCEKCAAVDYHGLKKNLTDIIRNYIRDDKLLASVDRVALWRKSENQKQKRVLDSYNALVGIVNHSWPTEKINSARLSLCAMESIIMSLGKCNKGHDWSKECGQCANCGFTRKQAHEWNGCKCMNCEATRDEGHAWSGCKCERCGATRDEGHTWSGCKCSICGATRDADHDYSKDCECCSVCGHGGKHQWNTKNKTNNKCTRCGMDKEIYLKSIKLLEKLHASSDYSNYTETAESLVALGHDGTLPRRVVAELINKYVTIDFWDLLSSPIIKALAEIGDKRAVPILLNDLKKTNEMPSGCPPRSSDLIPALTKLEVVEAIPELKTLCESSTESWLIEEAQVAIAQLSKLESNRNTTADDSTQLWVMPDGEGSSFDPTLWA